MFTNNQNQLTNPLDNLKQGAVKDVVGGLGQNKPRSTNKAMGGFFKPTVKRKAAVISPRVGKMRTFHKYEEDTADFKFKLSNLDPTRPEINVADTQYFPSRQWTDEEVAGLTNAQIHALLKKEGNEHIKGMHKIRAADRAAYRAVLDTANSTQRAIKLVNPRGLTFD